MSQSHFKSSEASVNGGNSGRPNNTELKEESDSNKSDPKNGSQESYRIKKLASELLDALCGKRIQSTKIKFTDGALRERGGSGDVAVATLVDDSNDSSQLERQVAVKKIRLSPGMTLEGFLKAFVHELRVLDKLSHPHIAKIIGFVEDIQSGIAWMIFPWEAKGNIREFLSSGAWEIPERVSLIQDVAAGLEYLHSRHPPICHGDLKSLNILVNDSYRACITDFGSARVMRAVHGDQKGRPNRQPTPWTINRADLRGHHDQSGRINLSLSGGQLTLSGPHWSLRWAAPEVLGGQDPDLASDVWAFGWVCWEIITDNFPFSDTRDKNQIIVKVVRGQLPSTDVDDQLSQILSLRNVMLRCWEPEPNERPSAIECQRLLGWIPFSIPAMKSDDEPEIRSAALLMQIGEMYRVQDQNDAALNAFQKGLTIARSTGDKAAMRGILLQLGHLWRVESRYIQADESYAEAMEIYKGAGDGLGQANALIGRGNIHSTWSKDDEAEGFFVNALELYTPASAGGDHGRGNALVGLGRIHHTRSKYAEAERCYIQALAVNINIGSILGQVNAPFGVERIQMIRSDYAEAEKSFTQALELSTSIGNRFNQGGASLGLGDAYRARSKYAKAEESFARALEIFEIAGNRLGQATALLGLGNVYHGRANNSEAEKLCSQARKIYKSVGYGMGRGNALCGLGSIRRAQSEHAKAEKCYVKALEVYTGLEHSAGYSRAEALLGLGDTDRERSKYAEAEKSYVEALEIFTRDGNNLGRANALRGLGHIHRASSKYEQAEELYNQALEISTSLEDEFGQADSSLGLGELRICQARHTEAKALIEHAAEISERLEYQLGKDQSEKLLLNVLEVETQPLSYSLRI
ncbi:hypothetical protein M407DRAFT_21622 [Tulasnella calospora MUT 4182]|uniref:Protein kinase domain-containing protein n=1 Tax=Tulasnella calospora MUT 4182 TaxID=1051891 RepID=A0A0C3QMS3_9AGAM|nr:hypothetical protein M407DRAFT_21622 [Tulasnella calospora MUT 4182]